MKFYPKMSLLDNVLDDFDISKIEEYVAQEMKFQESKDERIKEPFDYFKDAIK